jgi:hypothetical protein
MVSLLSSGILRHEVFGSEFNDTVGGGTSLPRPAINAHYVSWLETLSRTSAAFRERLSFYSGFCSTTSYELLLFAAVSFEPFY